MRTRRAELGREWDEGLEKELGSGVAVWRGVDKVGFVIDERTMGARGFMSVGEVRFDAGVRFR